MSGQRSREHDEERKRLRRIFGPRGFRFVDFDRAMLHCRAYRLVPEDFEIGIPKQFHLLMQNEDGSLIVLGNIDLPPASKMKIEGFEISDAELEPQIEGPDFRVGASRRSDGTYQVTIVPR